MPRLAGPHFAVLIRAMIGTRSGHAARSSLIGALPTAQLRATVVMRDGRAARSSLVETRPAVQTRVAIGMRAAHAALRAATVESFAGATLRSRADSYANSGA